MSSPFDSAWMKWGRGVVHAHTLNQELIAYIAQRNRKDITLGVAQYDPKRHGFPVVIAAVTPLPSNWGILLGDVAANWLAALDHIAWAMVHLGKGGKNGFPLTQTEARNVYFPIVTTDATQFKNEIATKLIGVKSRKHIALVRKLQPYMLKRRNANHGLKILHDLCRADKHRSVQPVHMAVSEARYKLVGMRDCEPSTDPRLPKPRHSVVDVGVELGLIRVRKTGPNPGVHAEMGLGGIPGVTPRNPLDEWLHKTGQLISVALMHLAPPPPELVQLGDPRLFFPT